MASTFGEIENHRDPDARQVDQSKEPIELAKQFFLKMQTGEVVGEQVN